MPPALLNAYIAALPRLTAEESLLAAERVAVGTGSLRRGQARRVAQAWQRATDQQTPRVRARGAAEYAAQMAGMGIGVKLTKVDKPDG